MATIKAGAYRFNDELTLPSGLSGELSIPINYTTRRLFDYDGTTLVPDDTRHDLNRITVYLQDGVLKVKESYIESGGGASSEFVCYEGGGVGWNVQANMHERAGYTNFALAKGFGQIINVTEDTVVEDESVADWFEENTKQKMFKMLYAGETVYSSGGKGFKRLAVEEPPQDYGDAGLYDANDSLVASWDTLVNTYGMDCEKNYTSSNYETNKASPYYVLKNYSALASGVKLKIDNSVTSIGIYAFLNCTSLTSIVIPDSVTSIGGWAFRNCSSLTSIDIPDSVISIDKSAFSYCNSLKSITIPDSVTSIGAYAFLNCTSLTSIDIPDSVTSIDDYALAGCDSLTSVVIGDNVTSIGYDAFAGCKSLTSIDIPDSVTSISESAFRDCTSLVYNEYDNARYLGNSTNPYTALIKAKDKSITSCAINHNTKCISEEAFYKCTSLTSIDIPDSVTSIGYGAFRDCTSLTSIVIPDSITRIGANALKGCGSFINIYINSIEAWCSKTFAGFSVDPTDYSNFNVNLYLKGELVTELTMPDTVTSIKRFTFTGCTSLTSVVIGNSVTSIDKSAFYYCKSLTSIVIPDSVTSIGGWAFAGCKSLTSIDIPDSVTSISEAAFSYCNSLKSTTIPDSVTSIGNWAFEYCTSLTSIDIPDSVTSIGYGAFRDCTSLTSIDIPDSVTSMGASTFRDCTSLTSIVIPDSVTSIGNYAFEYCKSLTSIKYRGTQAQWNAITKGTKWDYDTGNYTITYNYTGD